MILLKLKWSTRGTSGVKKLSSLLLAKIKSEKLEEIQKYWPPAKCFDNNNNNNNNNNKNSNNNSNLFSQSTIYNSFRLKKHFVPIKKFISIKKVHFN